MWGKAPADELELSPRMGGIALKNGLILVSERNWAAAIREADGAIRVASGKKVRLPGSGESGQGGQGAVPGGAAGERVGGAQRHGAAGGAPAMSAGAADAAPGALAGPAGRAAPYKPMGVPVVRGLERFAETILVLGTVKRYLPNARLPLEGGRVMAALTASLAATSAVRAFAPKSAFVQEAGAALATFLPAVLALKGSAISGYHGAEHKVIGGRETALRAAAEGGAQPGDAEHTIITGDSAAATKEHDRCGSNIVAPYLLATVATNLLARGRSGMKTPAASAVASAASLGLALEALRWASRHGDNILAKLMMSPGRIIQKKLTTSEPTSDQLEVGERALTELMRVEMAGA